MEAQGQNSNARQGQVGGGEAINGDIPAGMDTGDWRNSLSADFRERMVGKITDTLYRNLPFSGQEGWQKLRKVAVRFEETVYMTATSQSHYLKWISAKMLAIETKNFPQFNGANTRQNPSDQVVLGMGQNPVSQNIQGNQDNQIIQTMQRLNLG